MKIGGGVIKNQRTEINCHSFYSQNIEWYYIRNYGVVKVNS